MLPRFHVLENHKKWVVETGLRIKVVSQQDFRQDFLSIELGPWFPQMFENFAPLAWPCFRSKVTAATVRRTGRETQAAAAIFFSPPPSLPAYFSHGALWEGYCGVKAKKEGRWQDWVSRECHILFSISQTTPKVDGVVSISWICIESDGVWWNYSFGRNISIFIQFFSQSTREISLYLVYAPPELLSLSLSSYSRLS